MDVDLGRKCITNLLRCNEAERVVSAKICKLLALPNKLQKIFSCNRLFEGMINRIRAASKNQ